MLTHTVSFIQPKSPATCQQDKNVRPLRIYEHHLSPALLCIQCAAFLRTPTELLETLAMKESQPKLCKNLNFIYLFTFFQTFEFIIGLILLLL